MIIKKNILLIFIFIALVSCLQIDSLSYVSTAKSIGWSGAYSSIALGLDAMLFNPAGIYMSEHRFALNLFGSYASRVYSNFLSSDAVIDFLNLAMDGKNLTTYGWIDKNLLYIPDTGVVFGAESSITPLMSFLRFSKFSVALGIQLKSKTSFLVDKDLFITLFKHLDLTKTNTYDIRFYTLNYADVTFSLSSRASFLEKRIPIQGIYTGLTVHLYLPYLLAKSSGLVKIKPILNSSSGFYDNYRIRVKGMASVITFPYLNELFKYASVNISGNDLFADFVGGSDQFSCGVGFDLGVILKFNRFIRLGFSVTDLGFIVLAEQKSIYYDSVFDATSSNTDILNRFRDSFFEELKDEDNVQSGLTEIISSPTAIRAGIAITPFKKELVTIAVDLALSDLNLIAFFGYPIFNVSVGVEFLPGYKWFFVPLRTAFSYNTESNYPSFSFGTGLYLGPVEMEIGVKGLEVLISDWGAKEIIVGADFKFQF